MSSPELTVSMYVTDSAHSVLPQDGVLVPVRKSVTTDRNVMVTLRLIAGQDRLERLSLLSSPQLEFENSSTSTSLSPSQTSSPPNHRAFLFTEISSDSKFPLTFRVLTRVKKKQRTRGRTNTKGFCCQFQDKPGSKPKPLLVLRLKVMRIRPSPDPTDDRTSDTSTHIRA
ncbi:hypothetical protein PROFUN_13635 [Planoprotostelium fungivorum]|uniref:Uncharacterized protein n=1 Tax=Planoprotostelium fungivorum TaxID=1890364 RepID=A0A2P6MZV4_9EUKA|nr:hypothetical protein PROFUN_13635 [Planoprotostelium fungivorum]